MASLEYMERVANMLHVGLRNANTCPFETERMDIGLQTASEQIIFCLSINDER